MTEAPLVASEPPRRVLRLADEGEGHPTPALSVSDGVALIIGIVIGSAIFQTPALVAANAGSGGNILLVWVLGAVVSLIGALCWAELGSTYPDAGGDYHYLTRAWGSSTGFLFAWARITVIQTGSIALIAFVFGDYATQILNLGTYSPAIYAGVAVVAFTLLHLVGVHLSRNGQRWLTAAQIIGLVLLVLGGFFLAPAQERAATPMQPMTAGGFGLAMVFVLLTYGGWNEAAFVSAEIRNPRRNMVRVLVFSILIIAAIYLLLNIALIQRLGVEGMSSSQAVGADLMRQVAGERGALLVSLLVVACALASINAMIFTGARTSYAMGRDFHLLGALGRWRSGGSVPANALIAQALIILLLVTFGAIRRKGFETMVDYTAPVFWLFFLLTTLSLIRLRMKDRSAARSFSVPLYPLTPLLFAVICAYLLYSSIVYTGVGSTVGLAVVAAGVPVFFFCRRSNRPPETPGRRKRDAANG
jgi:basic amino acid/polyamine antiporter, APA family